MSPPRRKVWQPNTHRRDFFTDEEVLASMKRVAKADPLVLFIGAGVSASRGLPDWSFMLRRLVTRGARQLRTLTHEGRTQFVDELQKVNDPTILGSIIRRLYPTYAALSEEIRQILYTRADAPLSMAFVHAVCRLILVRRAAGLTTLVVTTNYDDVLEHAFLDDPFVLAIEEQHGQARVLPVYSEGGWIALQSGDLPIFHIHGFVPNQEQAPPRHDIVLSARDYGTNWSRHWTHRVLAPHWRAQWLFVGMSFHDPHISFILAERQRHARARRPIGIFSLQGQPWLDLEDEAQRALVQAEVARLGELGMAALHTNYYFEDSQFLHEVCSLVIKNTPRVKAYGRRRQDWAQQFNKQRLLGQKSPRWRAFQDEVHSTLVEIREEVEGLASEFAVEDGEEYKVELWHLDLDASQLVMLGTSQHVNYDLSRTARFPLAPASRIAAVSAFTRGGPHAPDISETAGATRWRYYLGVPVRLISQPWDGLVVGTLVLASNVEKEAATIFVQRAAIGQELESWMARSSQLLDPSTTDA